jgi:hypothetical protein
MLWFVWVVLWRFEGRDAVHSKSAGNPCISSSSNKLHARCYQGHRFSRTCEICCNEPEAYTSMDYRRILAMRIY